MFYCSPASTGYLASPTHTDESQLLSGSVYSECTSPVWHRSSAVSERKHCQNCDGANVCVHACLLTWHSLCIQLGVISPPSFNFSLFIVRLFPPLCWIHKQLGWIKHFNHPRLISAYALNPPSSRGKATVTVVVEICTSSCGQQSGSGFLPLILEFRYIHRPYPAMWSLFYLIGHGLVLEHCWYYL